MNSWCESYRSKYNDITYTIFRVLVGVMFMFHGAQKLFGLFSQNGAQPLLSLMGLAGVIEFFGGLLIAIGLFVIPAAAISTLLMLVAYFMAHAGKGALPIQNGGEMALLYFAAFLAITFIGPGKYSVDAMMGKAPASAKSAAKA